MSRNCSPRQSIIASWKWCWCHLRKVVREFSKRPGNFRKLKIFAQTSFCCQLQLRLTFHWIILAEIESSLLPSSMWHGHARSLGWKHQTHAASMKSKSNETVQNDSVWHQESGTSSPKFDAKSLPELPPVNEKLWKPAPVTPCCNELKALQAIKRCSSSSAWAEVCAHSEPHMCKRKRRRLSHWVLQLVQPEKPEKLRSQIPCSPFISGPEGELGCRLLNDPGKRALVCTQSQPDSQLDPWMFLSLHSLHSLHSVPPT